VLKTYGAAPYAAELKKLEKEIKDKQQTINEKIGRLICPLWAPRSR
jgi:26S proteasome regulatory subunit T1